MTIPDNLIEELARAWASIDGKTNGFDRCKKDAECDLIEGCYSGYVAEVHELLRRSPSVAAALTDDLPFRRDDIKRGLILFRTSNNTHGYTNFVSLTAKVDALPQVAKDELATIMRNFADGLSPMTSIPHDPSEAMIDAAMNVNWECDGDERGTAVNVWHAMYATALAGTRAGSTSDTSDTSGCE